MSGNSDPKYAPLTTGSNERRARPLLYASHTFVRKLGECYRDFVIFLLANNFDRGASKKQYMNLAGNVSLPVQLVTWGIFVQAFTMVLVPILMPLAIFFALRRTLKYEVRTKLSDYYAPDSLEGKQLDQELEDIRLREGIPREDWVDRMVVIDKDTKKAKQKHSSVAIEVSCKDEQFPIVVELEAAPSSHCLVYFFDGFCILLLVVGFCLASWSPVVAICVHYFEVDLSKHVREDNISGVSVWMPFCLCALLGVYTALQAIELSHAKVILAHKRQEFGETGLESVFLNSLMKDTPEPLGKQLLEYVRTVNKFLYQSSPAPPRIFHGRSFAGLLKNSPGRVLGEGYYALNEEGGEFEAAEKLGFDTKQIGSWWLRSEIIYFSCIQAAIPELWMSSQHGWGYFFTGSWMVILMRITSALAGFLAMHIILMVSFNRRETFGCLVVQQVIMLLLNTPDKSREFLYNLYKSSYLDKVCICCNPDDKEGLVRIATLKDVFGTSGVATREAFEGQNILKKLGQEMQQKQMLQMKKRTIPSDFMLNIEKYSALGMWLKVDIMLQRIQLSYWVHFLVVIVMGLIVVTAFNIFVWRRVTSLCLAALWALMLIGYILFDCFSLSVSFNRIFQDDRTTLLENWNELIKKVRRNSFNRIRGKGWVGDSDGAYVDNIVDQFQIDNFFKELQENIDRMISNVKLQGLPIIIFGMTITAETMTRIAIAMTSLLATGIFNFVHSSKQVHNAIEELTQDITGANMTIT